MGVTAVYSILQVKRLIAGINSIDSIGDVVAEQGVTKALVLSDQGVWNAGLVERPLQLLQSAGVDCTVIHEVPPEPTVEDVEQIFQLTRVVDCQIIICIGGGSVMDVGKIVAVLKTNDASVRDLLTGSPIKENGIPTLMVPTTAGTGAEVTQNAIVLVPEDEVKIGIVSSKLVPDCAILDPAMTVKLPPHVTASTGMDALAHAIECYISKKANPFSDTYALKAVELICRSIRQAYRNGNDLQARHDMLLGAMFGGMCIATSSTTAVHALAYPLGGRYRIPHGLSNAILLPHVMKFNLDASEDKFRDIAIAMGIDVTNCTVQEAAAKMIENLFTLIEDLHMNIKLSEKGIGEQDLEIMAESAAKVTRLLNNNPKQMNRTDMIEIYRKLL